MVYVGMHDGKFNFLISTLLIFKVPFSNWVGG